MPSARAQLLFQWKSLSQQSASAAASEPDAVVIVRSKGGQTFPIWEPSLHLLCLAQFAI
jgi:hypothetical protein